MRRGRLREANAAHASRPNTLMLAHPSGSASPNLPSEAKLLRRISRHFPQIRSTAYPHSTVRQSDSQLRSMLIQANLSHLSHKMVDFKSDFKREVSHTSHASYTSHITKAAIERSTPWRLPITTATDLPTLLNFSGAFVTARRAVSCLRRVTIPARVKRRWTHHQGEALW